MSITVVVSKFQPGHRVIWNLDTLLIHSYLPLYVLKWYLDVWVVPI